ncbi:hypothetical protein DNTS_035400 [Danionella cerebrum]|uniref:Calpain catalytic domain-containing protein n=1 Tax=Danionella cerebrum TaxID=2873325 RepID=A0A553NWB1_9TELE|nr:hypothetical protein DNTS_035400 [Danionella translucida]
MLLLLNTGSHSCQRHACVSAVQIVMETEPEHNELFLDADFPAADSSIFCDYATPLSKLLDDVAWLRPHEICNQPQLFPDDPVEAHPKQGILGDCWLLCACSMLLKNQHLLNKVFPPGQPVWGNSAYCGTFLFRFWRSGQWTMVRVDDRLPCLCDKLCFSQCQSPKAFWVALLEKAYAKLHGSYEHLWAGQVCEAMVDLTGSLSVRWCLKSQPSSSEMSVSKLSAEMKERCAISCCIHSTPIGVPELGQFHAMSVMEWTDVTTTAGEQVQLIRIRNPWGRRSWAGVWKESGSGWSSLLPSCARGLLDRMAEGEFWMDLSEFQQEFDEVTVGFPISEEGHVQSIYTGNCLAHSHQIGGRWIKGHSAGGCRNNSTFGSNPKFWLRVCERGEVLLSLLQYKQSKLPAGGSTEKNLHLQAIALHGWKVDKKHFNLAQTLNKPPFLSQTHAYDREVHIATHLSPGCYLLVPSAFQQGSEGNFLLRVNSSCSISLSAMKSAPPALQLSSGGEWETSTTHGCWTVGSTAGGSRNYGTHSINPRVPFTVTCDPGGNNVRVSLHQHRPETDLYAIGFHIYKVPDGGPGSLLNLGAMVPVVTCVPHAHSEEVSVFCHLFPGEYIVVPSTYQPELCANFSLTVVRRIYR